MTSEESFMNNYGAVLQGFALFEVIKGMGYNPVVVRYRGGEFSYNILFYLAFCVKRKLGQKYHGLMKKNNEPISSEFDIRIVERQELFKGFQDEYIVFWNSKRISWYQLKKNYPISDIYICGSDQIWNPYFKRGMNDPGYFLAFAPSKANKIAYAPSFGCNDIPRKAIKSLPKLLSGFRSLSVREDTGIDIIRKYTNCSASVVLDPTMLLPLGRWNEIAHIPKNLPLKYILCYRFAYNSVTKDAISAISKKMKMPIVVLPLSNVSLVEDSNENMVFDAGPCEFIGLVNNAALVCTDSFHATVFSIIQHTQFITFPREMPSKESSMNSRVIDLLTNCDLLSRYTDDIEKALLLSSERIDFANADNWISEKRNESMLYLKKALGSSI